MQPLVSICIPTFNRAGCLKETIESIINQPEFISELVEIVISDNASTDDTKEMCESYKIYPNFHYYRNRINVRDKNFPIALSKASGKLRKLNNDTFVLQQGSLEKLCYLVQEYEEKKPVIFLTNKDTGDRVLDFHDFVLKIGYLATWLPSHTFWENDCITISEDFAGCELSLWQVRKTYEIASEKDNVILVGGKIGDTITPPKKNVSYGLYKVFYQNYFYILDPYIEKGIISNEDKDVVEKQLLFEFFLPWIVTSKLMNTDMQFSKEEDLKRNVFSQYQNKPYFNKFKRMYLTKIMKGRIKQLIKRFVKLYEKN